MGTSVDDFLSGELTAKQAEELLGGEGLNWLEVINQHLWDGRVFMRRNAALVSRMRQVPTDWTLLLAVATKDTDALVRENALLALGRIDGPLDDALPALLRGLTDRAQNVRSAARDSLFNLAATRRVDMIPHLIRGLILAP